MATDLKPGNIHRFTDGFRRRWNTINNLLFDAPGVALEIGAKRQLELQTKLTFFFAALNTVGLFFALRFENVIGIFVILILSVILWLAYALSRTKYYGVGGALAISIWLVITFAYALSGSTANGPLFALVTFLPLVFALSTALLSYQYQTLLVVSSLIFCFLMPVFEPGITANRSFNSSVGVLICLGGLTLVNQSYRNKIEQ